MDTLFMSIIYLKKFHKNLLIYSFIINLDMLYYYHRMLRQPSAIRRHFRTMHPKLKPYFCTSCALVFVSSVMVQSHECRDGRTDTDHSKFKQSPLL